MAPTPAPWTLRSLTARKLCGAEAQSQLDLQDHGQQPARGQRLLLLLLLQKSVSRAPVHSMMHLSSRHRTRLTGACNQERTRRCLSRGAAGQRGLPSSIPLPAGTPLPAPTGITTHPPTRRAQPAAAPRGAARWTAGEGRPGRDCAGTLATKSEASPRLLLDPHFCRGLCVFTLGHLAAWQRVPARPTPPPGSRSCPEVAWVPAWRTLPGPRAPALTYGASLAASFPLLPPPCAALTRICARPLRRHCASQREASAAPDPRPRPASGSRGTGTNQNPARLHLPAPRPGGLQPTRRARDMSALGPREGSARPFGARVATEAAETLPIPGHPSVCPSGSAGTPIRGLCLGTALASPSVCAACAGVPRGACAGWGCDPCS